MISLTIVYNPVAAKLLDPTHQVDLHIQHILSYAVAGAEQQDSYQTGHWDGRASFYEMRQHRFPAGFVPVVIKGLRQLGYEVNSRRAKMPAPLGPERPIFDEFVYKDERYDFQPETVDRLIRHGAMVAQVATGGGKSRIAQIATARIRRPTLFLTTRKVLMYQMKGHYENMLLWEGNKDRVGVLGDGEWAPQDWINVGMVQTFAARLKPASVLRSDAEQNAQDAVIRQTIKILERFELVILEEAHEASGNSYYNIMKRCKNAHYRLALTATPFMKEEEEDNMNLMACSGAIGIKVTEKQLIDCGILAQPIFKFVIPEKSKFLLRGTRWQSAYRLGVVESISRNAMILQHGMVASKYRLPTLVLVQQQKHGKMLEAAFRKNGVRCKFIFGPSKTHERDLALKELASGVIQVLIGSNILDVGVDCPALGMVINGAGGKAEVNLRQRIGRGLRAKKSGPNVCFFLDFNDTSNKHLGKHSATRRAIIQATPGFGENILLDSEPFPYHLFECSDGVRG